MRNRTSQNRTRSPWEVVIAGFVRSKLTGGRARVLVNATVHMDTGKRFPSLPVTRCLPESYRVKCSRNRSYEIAYILGAVGFGDVYPARQSLLGYEVLIQSRRWRCEIDHSKGNREMIKSRRSPHAAIFFAITMFVILPAASPAQVRVLLSGGFSAAYQELLPEFQKTTGITVTTTRGASQGDGPNTIGAQLRRGAPADMVIMSRNGLAELFAEGKIVMGSDVDLAEVPLGIGVRAGASRPDISTVDAVKQTLLRAKSLGTQSSSTIYVTTKLFPQLGIASAMAGKLSNRRISLLESNDLKVARFVFRRKTCRSQETNCLAPTATGTGDTKT